VYIVITFVKMFSLHISKRKWMDLVFW